MFRDGMQDAALVRAGYAFGRRVDGEQGVEPDHIDLAAGRRAGHRMMHLHLDGGSRGLECPVGGGVVGPELRTIFRAEELRDGEARGVGSVAVEERGVHREIPKGAGGGGGGVGEDCEQEQGHECSALGNAES